MKVCMASVAPPEELTQLRTILQEQLETLMVQSREALSSLVEVRDTDADPLDLAVTESNRDFTLRMADRERRLVSKIRHALERMNNGEYGACESCGAPITFGHYRVGRQGRLFRCLKFRSMVRNSEQVLTELLSSNPEARAEWERDQKLRHDPRVTGVGEFLRKTSLDELPQLINILRGEMHFVGPRPVTVGELRKYGAVKRHYLSVTPGLTGLWQVSGRNNTTYDQRVALDTDYVERRNPFYDAWIVLRTVKVLITREGAL